MCAGVTVFEGMKQQKIPPGAVVAVQGIGGLGHLAIQFAAKSGYKVVALSGSDSKRELATKLGAHVYVDGSKQDAVKELQKLGGAAHIIATAFDAEAQSRLVDGLGVGGKLLSLGVDMKPFKVTPVQLIPQGKSLVGHPSGSPQASQETLEFALHAGIEPMIELYSLEDAQKAYDQMMSSKARFRAIIVPGYKK